ncbi:MAG: hypothetical protein ACJ760_11000 [Thermoleophilaceae bacterium]
MRWRKRGHVFAPDGTRPWARRYAFPPTPHRLDDEVLRVYVACCDERTVGRVGYVDVLLEDPSTVVRVAPDPVLDIGEPGCFDDNGVVPTMVLPVGDELWLYYTGYQLGTRVPYFQFLGLAVSTDGGETFERRSRAPVLDRSDAEPLTRSSAFVAPLDGRFRMYYAAGAGWTRTDDGRAVPVYDLRVVESDDGVVWPAAGRTCVTLQGDEHAIGRPWLLPGSDPWRLLYSARSASRDYRIGVAVSDDGLRWERRDGEAGIDVSADGWDSAAVAYASVVEHGERVLMLHCGNERGATGFGWAELESW